MKLTFLGTGSAFIFWDDNYQSNAILENEKGERLLIDCGSDARQSLHDLNLTHNDIDSVFITHLHGDHIGGLEWLGFTRKYNSSICKPKLYAAKVIICELEDRILVRGLSTVEGGVTQLSSFFDLHSIDTSGLFTWSGIEFQLVQMAHVMSGYSLEPSFGLLFKINEVTVFFTGDTQLVPYQIRKFYEKADLIFHDCEITKNPSNVHAHYNELKLLPEDYKSKMWLYHYNEEDLPNAIRDGFRGFVKKGQCFNFYDPNSLK